MASQTLEIGPWAEQQFGSCELGDRRRTKRLMQVASQMANRPDGSTPRQTERWSDCKAAYRLFDRAEATFEALVAPHCAQTRQVPPGVWLVINDTTELYFGYERCLSEVGRVGPLDGQGFYLHTALVVAADEEAVLGMAAQELYARPRAKVPRVNSARRKSRARETDVWGRVIDAVGRAPTEARFVHVCDRGADNFEVYCHLRQQQAGWVIRAAQLRRVVQDAADREQDLETLLATAACLGHYELEVGRQRGQPARTARIAVRSLRVRMPRPRSGVSRYVREQGVEHLDQWVVEAREVGAPRGVEPLRWVLWTSEAVAGFDDAWRVLEWYEQRPLIEEYHKCLKTGCRVEGRQYQSGARLAPVIGLCSVLAVRLLQLKLVARQHPEQPAAEVVPSRWLTAVPLLLKRRQPLQTVRDFFRALAQLGGFLARRHDGEPGWQTIWHGLETLLLSLHAADALGKKCG